MICKYRNAADENNKTAVIIPCYNEAVRLKTDAYIGFLDDHQGVEFYFVDDGSVDNTLKMLVEMTAASVRCHVVKLDKNCGKAQAVFKGVNEALKGDFKYIGYWDADLATPLYMIPEFIELLDTGKYNSVLGCRIQRLGATITRKTFRHYQGRFLATIVSSILHLPIYDSQCGAKIFRVTGDFRESFSVPFTTKWLFDVELIARLQKLNAKHKGKFADTVYEFPLTEWHDVAGSKVRMRDGVSAFFDLMKIKV